MTNATISPVEVMKAHRVIAVVGASKNPEKEAHTVPAYLKDHGYRVVPVNPTADQILGEKAFPSLASLPDQLARDVEVVEVFRPSEELPQVARQVVEMSKKHGRSYIFWSQLGSRTMRRRRYWPRLRSLRDGRLHAGRARPSRRKATDGRSLQKLVEPEARFLAGRQRVAAGSARDRLFLPLQRVPPAARGSASATPSRTPLAIIYQRGSYLLG